MPAAQSKQASKQKVSKAGPSKKVESKKQPKSKPVEEPAPSTELNEVVSEEVLNIEQTVGKSFSAFTSNLQGMTAQLAALRAEFKALEKMVSRELRVLDKINAKKKASRGTRAPSGFVKPTKISKELADFLGKEHGSEMARTDVTSEITKYVRAHSLQDKKNGRKINPDTKLKALLKVPSGEELTYFNLQKYMSPHFEKSTKASS